MNAGSLSPPFGLFPDTKRSGKQVFLYDKWAWIMEMFWRISQMCHGFLQELPSFPKLQEWRFGYRWLEATGEGCGDQRPQGVDFACRLSSAPTGRGKTIQNLCLCHSNLKVLSDQWRKRPWKVASPLCLPICQTLWAVTKLTGLGWMRVGLVIPHLLEANRTMLNSVGDEGLKKFTEEETKED